MYFWSVSKSKVKKSKVKVNFIRLNAIVSVHSSLICILHWKLKCKHGNKGTMHITKNT